MAGIWTKPFEETPTTTVTSVFGRSGAVVAANGDYTADKVVNTPAGGISAINVQDAVNALDNRMANMEVNTREYTIYELHTNTQTNGTATITAHSTIMLDRFEGAADALATRIDSNNRPIDDIARTSTGVPITVTFNGSGNYTLSGTPADSNWALVFKVALQDRYKTELNNDYILDEIAFYSAEKILVDNSVIALPGVTNVQGAIESIILGHDETKDPTGFTDPAGISVSYDPTSRTVTLTHNSGSIHYLWRGRHYDLTSPWVSPAHVDVAANYFLYSTDGTTFGWSTTPWEFNHLQVAYCQYNSHDIGIREVHGLMDWRAHEEFHTTIGTYLVSGADLSDYTVNSTTPADRRPNVSTTVIKDEDLQTIVSALSTKTYTQRFLSGAAVRSFNVGASEIVPVVGDVPYYNQFTGGNWVQTPFSNNSYGAIFLVAIPATADAGSQAYRYMWVQPQQISGTLSEIQALTPSNLTHGDTSSLVSEFVFVGKIIIRYTGNNWVIISAEKLTGTRAMQIATPSGTFLSSVTTDTTLTGNGTAGSPLSVVNPIISTPPATATSTGVPGTIAYDSGFIYVCVSSNTWQRAPISTW